LQIDVHPLSPQPPSPFLLSLPIPLSSSNKSSKQQLAATGKKTRKSSVREREGVAKQFQIKEQCMKNTIFIEH
jgi:hypothetical protein